MKSTKKALAAAFFGVSFNVFAAPITFDNVAGIEQLEWKHLGETLGLSRTQVEAQLASGGLLEGWRFATRREVAALLGQYWRGNYSGWALENKAAYKFIELLGNTDSQDPRQPLQFPGLDGTINWDFREGAVFSYGETGECPGLHVTCLGLVNVTFLFGVPTAGFLDAAWGLDPTSIAHGGLAHEALPTRANLLVRTATIPEPSTVLLLLGAVVALATCVGTRCGSANNAKA